jgi:hypothetical protein
MILFDRPKPTVGCSVSGRRRICSFDVRPLEANMKMIEIFRSKSGGYVKVYILVLVNLFVLTTK